mgnify:CR=1 FL=1
MAKTISATEIKKLAASPNIIIGTQSTIKHLKMGRLQKIIVSSNCPQKVMDDINHYAALANTEIIQVQYPNEELGVICKKPFAISVLSLSKEA